MNMQPPQLPRQQSSDRNILVAILVVVVAIGVYVLASSRGESTSAPAAVTTTTAAANISAGDATNKYDDFMAYARENSGQANAMGSAELIEYGDLVCQSLDNGYSIATVVDTVSRASGTASDLELGAAVISGAISYICPEYTQALETYLGSDSSN